MIVRSTVPPRYTIEVETEPSSGREPFDVPATTKVDADRRAAMYRRQSWVTGCKIVPFNEVASGEQD